MEEKFLQIALHALNNMKPEHASSKYIVMEEISMNNGMTFKPALNDIYNRIIEIELAKKSNAKGCDLFVTVKLASNDFTTIKLCKFDESLFDNVYNTYMNDKEEKRLEKIKDFNNMFIDAISNEIVNSN